jgi:hypothetical protein
MNHLTDVSTSCYFCNNPIKNENDFLMAVLRKPTRKSYGMSGKFITETTHYTVDAVNIPACSECKKLFLKRYRIRMAIGIALSIVTFVGLIVLTFAMFKEFSFGAFFFFLISYLIIIIVIFKTLANNFIQKNPKYKLEDYPEVRMYIKSGYQISKYR